MEDTRVCRTARHRLLAGRGMARGVKAGVRTPLLAGSVRTAGSGPGGYPMPERRRRRTRQSAHRGHGPGVVALRAPVRTTPPLARELRQQTPTLSARPAAREQTRTTGGLAATRSDSLPACPVFGPGPRRASACAGTGTVHARKGDSRHDFACQPAFHPATPSDDYPADDPAPQTCRPACRPWPGRAQGRDRDISSS